MFDVWDNRQLNRMKKQLGEIQTPYCLIDRIMRVQSFDELYKLLNLEYIIDKNGSLSGFPTNYFDCIFSFDTLEHIDKDSAKKEIDDFYRILKPDGFSIHQIGLDDHLSHYDKKEHRKKYVEFPRRTWKRLFENRVQYFNRLQASDWLNHFANAGFTLIEVNYDLQPLTGIKVCDEFSHYDKNDIVCCTLNVVHRKKS